MSYGFGKEDFENQELLEEIGSWNIKAWANRLGSPPKRLLESADYSEAYSMAKGHAFELENGKFATVIEQGCSCYTPREAKIELHPSEDKAMEKLREWKKERESLRF